MTIPHAKRGRPTSVVRPHFRVPVAAMARDYRAFCLPTKETPATRATIPMITTTAIQFRPVIRSTLSRGRRLPFTGWTGATRVRPHRPESPATGEARSKPAVRDRLIAGIQGLDLIGIEGTGENADLVDHSRRRRLLASDACLPNFSVAGSDPRPRTGRRCS